MNEFYKEALEKLERESKTAHYDKYAQIMHKGVSEALKEFCQQNEEFARAVTEGRSFEECMKAVAQNCGHGISDLVAYSRAVKFYMPGADIKFQMQIIQKGAAKPATPAAAAPDPTDVLIDITDLL